MEVSQERINRYWSGRADEFSGLRMDDYHGVMRKNYTDILREFLPRISEGHALDLGTGAGFFSFILSELEWTVTAIDYSSEMLCNARRNAERLGFPGITFLKMDAHNLALAAESFDAIVTRNVTWTLPDPQKAYAEMVRVLKPGGVIINFDANYGQAFRCAEQRGETPMHPTQTPEQLQERNTIATSLYIGEKNRPFWDIEVLFKQGIRHFQLDLEIDKRICTGSTLEKVYSGISKKDLEHFFLLYAQK